MMELLTRLNVLATEIVAVPQPEGERPPGMAGFEDVMNWVMWVGLAVCVIGIMVGGTLMAIQSRRGEGGEHVGRIGMALGGVIIIGAAAALVGFLA